MTSRTFLALLLGIFCVSARAQDPAPEVPASKKIEPHAKGLLYGHYDPKEPVAKNREESCLALKPYPGISQNRPYWLFVPEKYEEKKPLPLLIALHPRGRLPTFSGSMRFDEKSLKKYAAQTLLQWKNLAEEKKFLLLVPLGDPDVLWMGMHWFTGGRSLFFKALVRLVVVTHSVDRAKVYVSGSGEGAHAALATGVRLGGLLSAVSSCNPALFEGESLKGRVYYPETVDEMLEHAGKRKTPLFILAGDKDPKLKIKTHGCGGIARCRIEDRSSIPAEIVKKASDKLKAAGFKIKWKTIPTTHYTPLPDKYVKEIWDWLRKQKIPKKDQMELAPGGGPVEPEKAGGSGSRRGYMGVRLDGMVVSSVQPGGPADKAGLKQGDRITAVDGRAVKSRIDLAAAFAGKAPGDKVVLGIERDGESVEVEITLGERP
jgi:predicted esterase